MKKRSISKKAKNSTCFIFSKKFGFLLIFFCFLLSGFYVFQVTQLSLADYNINDCEGKLEQMVRENEDLQLNLVKNGSMNNLEALVQGLKFEKIGEIHYIKAAQTPVVAK